MISSLKGNKKCILLLPFLLLFTFTQAQTKAMNISPRPELFYVFDPLCGWCYAFSPSMKQLYLDYQGVVDVTVVNGGLVMGDRIGTIDEKFAFIKGAIPDLEKRTGVLFGDAFKQNILGNSSTYILTSEPLCRAVVSFKHFLPAQTMLFAHQLQQAFYVDGIDTKQEKELAAIAATFGIDPLAFLNYYASDVAKAETLKDFQLAQSFGATGFPTVILRKEDKYYLLTRGYTTYTDLKSLVDKVLQQ